MNTAATLISTVPERISYTTSAIENPQCRSLRKCGTTEVSHKDRVYVTLSIRGQKIAELNLTGMSSLSDIIAQLRYVAARYRGLAQMYIRNVTSGWSMKRPLMLYST